MDLEGHHAPEMRGEDDVVECWNILFELRRYLSTWDGERVVAT